MHQRPGDGDPLHLAARELVGMAVRERRDANQFQHLQGAVARLALPRELKGKLHVLDRAQGREELQELEDEADAAAAELGQRVVVQGGGPDPFDLDPRPPVGRSAAPARLSRVVLPQPLRPTTASHSPRPRSRETPLRAGTR